jgi:hypothetical protein
MDKSLPDPKKSNNENLKTVMTDRKLILETITGGGANDEEEVQAKSSPNPGFGTDEEEKIDKALKFWNHPSLQNITSEEKRVYLRERGITDAQIHKAWERMVEDGTSSKPISGTTGFRTNFKNDNNDYFQHQSAPQVPIGNSNYPYNESMYARQQQQQQPLSSYPNQSLNQQSTQFYPYRYPIDEEDSVISIAKGMSLVAVGGMLGITAAAAVRWLNGGDFYLFPPPTRRISVDDDKQLDAEVADDEMVHDHADDRVKDEYFEGMEHEDDVKDVAYQYGDYVVRDVDENELKSQQLAEKLDRLFESVSINTETQEKLMRKIAIGTSTITDQSMDLLRGSQRTFKENVSAVDATLLLRKLNEIKEDMAQFSNTFAAQSDREHKEKSNKIIEKLEKIMNILRQPTKISSDDTNVADSSTIMVTQEDIFLPSTPKDVQSGSGCSIKQIDIAAEPLAVTNDSMQKCIQQIANGNDATTIKVGTQLLYLYLVNLSSNPENPRYRKIYTSNQSFQKVEILAGGRELLQAVGFQSDGDKNFLEWVPSECAREEAAALILVNEAASSLGILKSGIPPVSRTEQASSTLPLSLGNGFNGTTPLQQRTASTSYGESADPLLLPPSQDDIEPQTPSESKLVSPPVTKKLLFPEGTPTISSDLSEQHSTANNAQE